MAVATYGSKGAYVGSSARGGSLQRPFQIVIMAADLLLILLSYVVGASLYSAVVSSPADGGSAGAGLFVGVVFVVIAYSRDVYATHRLLNLVWQLRNALFIWLTSLTILAVAAFLLKSTDNLSRGTVIVFAAIGGLGLMSLRFAWQAVFGTSFARSRLVDRKVILLSLKPLDFTATRFKDLRRNGFDIVRHFVLGIDVADGHWQRQIRDVIRQSHSADVDEYLLAIDWNELPMLRKLGPYLRAVPQPIRLLPDDPVADLVTRPFLPVSGTVAVEIQRPPLSILERLQKRCLDVGVALFALVLLTPLILTVAVLIKLDSPGAVIFRQSRRGFNGKPFEIWKFRTMTVCENGETIRQATKRDARITRIGRFLRMTSIDELPQLWNVLRGEMSLVGPRPHALAHDNYYDELISNYVYRHHMKPGLTGWAQVNGFRGETPTIDLMEKRVEYDVWYVGNWSIWLDLKILARTASSVLFQEAY
ncbi:undecaprenyl-phosphate glucose phosphotransferase [Bradyrhizobium sp. INPA01-394B]|uniref:Undecaprenyl-phosphate glucose phosphotransferase n=1 Tax=Bradyrhizobium campsiandrae TaxID=1729892 RepID=A0ABR7UEV4_9BRAD|nr:undecaprenyl-phosphate glucose phosphotransferase [Bradyrhizobium campsiandrae]MBC9878346.1 undecaprenyl-phosphate glucose phosphotransferase [Bradyrhizobium campsiandrae]MBC9982428.1 undecaprenyl-phosphate glucose phosphotransferase [Bradyrhizobium campsiandrae]